MDDPTRIAQLQQLAAAHRRAARNAPAAWRDENRSLRQQPGAAGQRTRALADQERTGAFARRGDDHPPQVAGAATRERERTGQRPASSTASTPSASSRSERDSLMAAAHLLDARMREMRGSNKMAALDRVAVLAALNLAHELHAAARAATSRERGTHPHARRAESQARRRCSIAGDALSTGSPAFVQHTGPVRRRRMPSACRLSRLRHAALYFACILCRVRQRAQTFALSLKHDPGIARERRCACPPRCGKPDGRSRGSHLNPGIKVVSQASAWRRMQFFDY